MTFVVIVSWALFSFLNDDFGTFASITVDERARVGQIIQVNFSLPSDPYTVSVIRNSGSLGSGPEIMVELLDMKEEKVLYRTREVS